MGLCSSALGHLAALGEVKQKDRGAGGPTWGRGRVACGLSSFLPLRLSFLTITGLSAKSLKMVPNGNFLEHMLLWFILQVEQ